MKAIEKWLTGLGLGNDAVKSAMQELRNLPAGSSVLAVGSAESLTWLNARGAAKLGGHIQDTVTAGGEALTKSLQTGAAVGVRISGFLGAGLSGFEYAYAVGTDDWTKAQYVAFDSAVTAIALKVGKSRGAVFGLVYNGIGGSETMAKSAIPAGLSYACGMAAGAPIP